MATENRAARTTEQEYCAESLLGRTYRQAYEALCGRHPNVRPWHFQWLATYYLRRRLRQILSQLGGRVLDVGCGMKPYQKWFGNVEEYIGLDVVPGAVVDLVVAPDEPWPLPDEYFDVILATQVLEHVLHVEHTIGEMTRVLRRGGIAVLSFPFLYNEHGSPQDYRRFTVHQAKHLLRGFEVLCLEKQGGIGSTLSILLLNWVDMSLNARLLTRLLKGFALPLWLSVSLAFNLLGVAVDKIDITGAFYNNVLLVARKPDRR